MRVDNFMKDNKGIKLFVRQTLGCECPEEVLRYINCEYNVKLNNDISLSRRINVGNRLLIYVIESNDSDFVKNNLSVLLHTGKNERDKMKFNRFRLVLATDKRDEITNVAERMFHSLPGRDEKIHLHIVERNAIPG